MSSDYQDYSPLGPYGTDYTPEAGACSEKCICNALDVGLSAIVSVLLEIDQTLKGKVDDSCKIVDTCKDQIIQIVDEHFRYPTKTCDECKADIANGMAGTLEFAVACAGSCVETTRKECSLGDPSTWGKPCDTCGEDCCICEQGVCTPTECPEEPNKDKQYVAWCNPATGSVVTLKQGQDPPGIGWTIVGYGDDEQSTTLEGINNCTKSQEPVPLYEPLPAVDLFSTFCDITSYADGDALRKISDASGEIFKSAAIVRTLDRVNKLGLEGVNLGSVSETISDVMSYVMAAPAHMAEQLIPVAAYSLGCDNVQFVKAAEVLGAFGFIDKATGAHFNEFLQPYYYAMHSQCRTIQLSPEKALDAYLSRAFDESILDAHFAIAGLCPEARTWSTFAAKSKLEPEQLIRLRHRKLIDTETYNIGFRKLGYLEQEIPSQIFAISEHIPSLNSVISFNAQGAVNQQTVAKLGLDKNESPLLGGPLAEWCDSEGISIAERKATWRAHWTSPGIGNLTEYWHRLRNDKTFAKSGALLNDIKQTLDSIGVTPYWQDHFLATMEQPLNKRDIRGAYNSGALDDKDIKPALEIVGHDTHSIGVLAKEYKSGRRQSILSHVALHLWTEQHIDGAELQRQLNADGYENDIITQAMNDTEWKFERCSWSLAYAKGFLSAAGLRINLTNHGVSAVGAEIIIEKLSYQVIDRQALKNYIAGTINRGEATAELVNDGLQTSAVERLLKNADDDISNALTSECVRGIKSRYLTGEISKDETHTLLLNSGLSLGRANDVLANFSCSKNAEGKQVAVEKLCNWLYIGAIGQPEFYDRLIRLGYTEQNASLLLYDCVQSNTLRAIKEADKLSRELQSQADKRERASSKALAAKERQAVQLAKMRKDKARIKEGRDKQLLSAVDKLQKKTDSTLFEATSAVKAALYEAENNFGLGTDEALAVVIKASERMKDLPLEAYASIAQELSTIAASSGLEASNSDIGLPPSSNGATQPSD